MRGTVPRPQGGTQPAITAGAGSRPNDTVTGPSAVRTTSPPRSSSAGGLARDAAAVGRRRLDPPSDRVGDTAVHRDTTSSREAGRRPVVRRAEPGEEAGQQCHRRDVGAQRPRRPRRRRGASRFTPSAEHDVAQRPSSTVDSARMPPTFLALSRPLSRPPSPGSTSRSFGHLHRTVRADAAVAASAITAPAEQASSPASAGARAGRSTTLNMSARPGSPPRCGPGARAPAVWCPAAAKDHSGAPGRRHLERRGVRGTGNLLPVHGRVEARGGECAIAGRLSSS